MNGSVFNVTMFLAIFPELWIFALATLVLILELALPKAQHRSLGWVTAIGLLLGIGVGLVVAVPSPQAQLVWGDLIRFDRLGFVFSLLFMFGASMTALFSSNLEKLGQRGDFYVLMLVSTLGMCLMASASDIIMLYLAIETTSIPLYILAGFYKDDEKSTEAGFKYLLFGAMTSAVMLFGFSYLYGLAGTTNLYELANQVLRNQLSPFLLYGVLGLILVGFAFKISAFPFHFWAPDVYTGAPTPIAGFLSTASKAAGFAVLVRVLWVGFPEVQPYWVYILSGVSIATMTLGNLLALAQRDMKRLLAYSSIAHAGYALIGFVAVSELGITSVIFYLVVYLLTNLAAFGTVAVFEKTSGSSEIASFAGLSRRSPWLAIMMLVAFLSLAGMPPFGGFVTKFAVFAAAVDRGLIGLAVVGVLNSIVGLYYYLTVLKVIYLYRSEEEHVAVPVPQASLLALAVLCIGVIAMGIFIAPGFNIALLGARALW
ncbi:MAG: NADH-quinone oxidoreductase subunit N [Anaerolineales bacterium]|nr:NADH-quinone oxidoreductase subunit N [Anaerolineales bacterium]MCS7246766.1 NADH-quinone oxidoreductase subunit N [Anaerolineales bacterium]MDW8160576.1 NADH-quinone oxidoreductase subunit N [Anaerolineales bacterium]MDW8447113.1 NADH-quinone oxidoreductase subunit N [Anaerolineales bacterium]